MKTYVVFSSREPLLILTQRSIRSGGVLERLREIGIPKFIAHEVPVERVRRQYRDRFDINERAVRDRAELRVLDYRGNEVIQRFPFSTFGPAFHCENQPEPQ